MKKSTLLLVGFLLCLLQISTAQTIIMQEDFQGGALPAGWSITTNADDGGWNFGTNTDLQSSSFPISSHTLMAATNDDACNCDKSEDYLISPSLDLSSFSYVFVSFASYYYHLTYQGATELATIEASTDGGSTWTVVSEVPANSGDWETKTLDLSAFAGQSDVKIAFHYNDDGGWTYGWAMDDVEVFEPVVGVDISVSTFLVGKYDPTPTFIGFPKYFNDNLLNLKAHIFNQATEPITSFDISWTDGVNTYNESVTGVNIPALAYYDFYPTNSYTVLDGSQTITFNITSVNGGASEISTTNNSLTFSVQGVQMNPDRKYLAEEGTGTWCGWCPRGAVFMHYMRETYPNQFVGIAVHNGDPMTNTTYDSELGISAFPTVEVNRKTSIDPSELESDFISRMTTAPVATVSGVALYDQNTNELSVKVTTNILQALSGDYRLSAVVVEDSVHGTSSQYKQSNYYADNAAGPMAGWENLPSSVPAAQMYYEEVGRELLGTFDGDAGSLPASMNAGENYSYTYTYTVPSTINVNHMWVAVLLIKHSTGEVMNANKLEWELGTGVGNIPETASVFVYPNPASDQTFIDLKLTASTDVTVKVVNNIGQIVASNEYLNLSGNQILPLNTSNYADGIYQVMVKAGDRTYIKKLIVGR